MLWEFLISFDRSDNVGAKLKLKDFTFMIMQIIIDYPKENSGHALIMMNVLVWIFFCHVKIIKISNQRII